MSRYLFPKLTLAIFFAAATIPAFSQVAPAAEEGGLPLVIGAGISDFNIDWGDGRRMICITAWADWNLEHLRGPLRNLSIEAEGHAIDYDRPAGLPFMRQDTGLGGLVYVGGGHGSKGGGQAEQSSAGESELLHGVTEGVGGCGREG